MAAGATQASVVRMQLELTGVDAEVLQPQLEVGHVDRRLRVSPRRWAIHRCQRQMRNLEPIRSVIQRCDDAAGRHGEEDLGLLANGQHVRPQQREVVTQRLLQR